MKVKITFFFESVESAQKYASASLGWTESWYAQEDAINNIDTWLTITDVLNYQELRLATLPDNYRLVWVRVSDEENPRSFKIRAIQSGFGTALRITVAETGFAVRGQVTCALLVDLARLPGPGDHTHHRRFLMRALPSDIINGNVVDTTGQNWLAVAQFLNWLAIKESGDLNPGAVPFHIIKNTTIGLRYQDPAFAAFTPSGAIVNNPGSSRDIDVTAALAGVVGQSQYVFKDFPDKVRALNKTWRLLAAGTGIGAVSTLGRARRDLPELSYTPPGPGKFRLFKPLYGLFNQYTIIGLRLKKTGRLFRQLRGRSGNR